MVFHGYVDNNHKAFGQGGQFQHLCMWLCCCAGPLAFVAVGHSRRWTNSWAGFLAKKVTDCVLGVSWTCLWCSAWWQRTIKTTCNTWYENTKSSVRLCYGKLPLEWVHCVREPDMKWNVQWQINNSISWNFGLVFVWPICTSARLTVKPFNSSVASKIWWDMYIQTID